MHSVESTSRSTCSQKWFAAATTWSSASALSRSTCPLNSPADLNQTDSAAYLGSETGGATGGKFGGRKLTDDVADISLGVVFGKTVSALGLAPADGKDIPTLTSDHVGAEGKHFTATFPYLGAPR